MSGQYRRNFPSRLLIAALPIACAGVAASAGPSAARTDPMSFFEGRTESISTIKVVSKKAYRSRTTGRGEISDGVLHLVQRVHEEGKAPYERNWRMRQVAPGRFAGTMSEAKGPVTAEEVGGRYRFRFRMKGNVSIEQWMMPLPGRQAARTKLVIRKFGMTVGRSEGTIRKL